MSYNIEIIRENQYRTSKWSGGTTTELYIYPVGSLYGQGNFKWRLSSAKVQVECSTFTSLPGISRIIMIIEGQLLLKHEGHHSATLKALEQDSFSGEWTTTSFGKVIDFNLMMAKGYKGKLEAISVNAGEVKDISVKDVKLPSQITEAFYILSGYIQMDLGAKEKTILKQGDLALVTSNDKENILEFKIHNMCHEECKIIKTSIIHY